MLLCKFTPFILMLTLVAAFTCTIACVFNIILLEKVTFVIVSKVAADLSLPM